MGNKRLLSSILIVITFTAFMNANAADNTQAIQSKKEIEKLLEDYIGLYKKESLDKWKELFDPSVIVAFPAEDDSINVRNLEEFLTRQRNFFAQRKSVSERLKNVQIFEGRRIGRIVADFVFIDEGNERRGKLGLHVVQSKNGWKIVALVFSYDQP